MDSSMTNPPYGKPQDKPPKTDWVQHRCTKCDALLFEINERSFKPKTVRIKCRLCKSIAVH